MNMNVYTYMYNFLKIYFEIQRNDKDEMRLAPPGREIQNGIRGAHKESHWDGSFHNALVVESQDFALYFLHVLYGFFAFQLLPYNVTKINIFLKTTTVDKSDRVREERKN